MWLKEKVKQLIYKERYSSEKFVEFLPSGGKSREECENFRSKNPNF